MSLLTEVMEQCQYIDKTTVDDGYGGVMPAWRDGATFRAAFSFDNSMEARRAEQEGVKNLYTITTRKGVGLMHGDIIRRTKDRALFRVTSDGTDKKTPGSASLDMRVVSAEMLDGLPDWSGQ